jgi:hypothetical protein
MPEVIPAITIIQTPGHDGLDRRFVECDIKEFAV